MTGVLARYEALVAAGELKPDPQQAKAAARLNQLQQQLEQTAEIGLLGRFLGRKNEAPRGLYL